MSTQLEFILNARNEGFKKGIKEAAESTKLLEKSFESLQDKIFEIGAIYLSFDFLKDAAKDFMKAETSANDLAQAVGMRGGTAESVKELVEQAEKLEKIGIFSEEMTKQVQTAGIQFGLTVEQVKKLTPLIEDFAARTHKNPIDLIKEVDRARVGKLGGDLKDLGLHFDKTATMAEKMAAVGKAIELNFAGANEQIAKTTAAGQLAQLENAFEKLKEDIGQGVMEAFVALKPVLEDFIRNLREGVKWIKEHWSQIETLGKDLIILVGVWKTYEVVVKGAKTAQLLLNAAMEINPVVAIVASIALAIVAYNNYTDAVERAHDALVKSISESNLQYFKDETAYVQKLAKEYENLGLKREEAQNKALNTNLSATQEALDKAKSELAQAEEDKKNESWTNVLTPSGREENSRIESNLLFWQNRVRKLEAELNSMGNKNNFFPKEKKEGKPDATPVAPSEKETTRENITINITKGIETIEVHSATLPEGANKVRDIFTQMFNEALSGIRERR